MTRQEMKRKSTLSVFVSYYRPHWGLFVLDMVCALLIALVDLAFPYLSRLSMQHLLPEKLYAAFFTVMAILVVYCLRSTAFTSAAGFVPQLAACLLVAALHLWKRNTLLSIAGGTAVYMLLIRLL